MKNKFIKISMILIGIILIIYGINQMIKYEVVSVQGRLYQSKASSEVKLAYGEPDPNSYPYNINTGSFVGDNANQGEVPGPSGFQIYCIEPNAPIERHANITIGAAFSLNGKVYEQKCGCAEEPHNGKRTPPLYNPGTQGWLSPAVAYVVSDEPIGQYSKEKQNAISSLGHQSVYIPEEDKYVDADGDLVLGGSYENTNSLVNEAKAYAEYDYYARKYGMKAEDKTEKDKVKVYVNTDKKEYMAGPFNLKYINGVYGDIAFSGITEMQIIGYDSNKKMVRDNIKVEKFLLKDEATGLYSKELQPDYFTPSKDLKVDKTSQAYPLSKQDFMVVFKDPNDEGGTPIQYISIKVKFKFMLAHGMFTELNGVSYIVRYNEVDYNIHPHPVYDCSRCDSLHEDCRYIGQVRCNDCKKTCYLESQHQQKLMAADAIRSIYEEEVHLAGEDPVDITIRVAGNVWEDVKGGKENTVDGVKGESEPAVSGIPVVLYSIDGTVVKTTVTDENGNYSFDKLDAMKKYYVEFKYNGQQYENTIYNNNLSGEYSNATESVKDRDAFNKKFEEIDGDEGYTLDKVNYDDGNPDYTPDEPFGISAYTGSDGKDKLQTYPKYDKFIIEQTDETINGVKYEAIYEKGDDQREVDFGIARRIQFDMAAKKDVYVATVKINGKTEVYGYDKKNLGNEEGTAGDTWNIGVVGGYDRGLSDDDYSFTGQNGNNQLLEVYVTYKIAVRNQSQTMLGHVTKLYDYYDSTYTYMPELSWTSSKNYRTDTNTLNKLQDSMEAENVEDNVWGIEPKVIEDKNDRLTIDVNKKQETGETVYLYLTFKVDGEGPQLSLGVKGNQTEIGSFKTYYKEGTILPHYGENSFVVPDDNMIAGRVDKDSIPSSMGPNGDVKEDDEDKAPGVDVHLTGDVRKLNGTVWEDERTLKSGDAVIGNGLKEDGELGVAGVKVELWERTVQGTDYLWKQTITDANGKYNFDGYVAGDYYVRFYYGHSKDIVTNEISYNGQDYKSTSYQVGVTQNETTDKDNVYKGYRDVNTQNESKTYGYDIAESEGKNVSDAKDIWSRRQVVNSYSKENVTNGIAEILASPYETPKYNGNSYSQTEMDVLIQELINNTYMVAETGVIVVEVEKNMQSNLENGVPSYSLKDIDLGLEERPKAQLEIDKSITNIRVTLANGSGLFDVNKSGDNVIWKTHEPYNLAENKDRDGKYEDYYGRNNKNRYSYRYENNYPINTADKGLVQLTMDEELMHGATITISYKVKVTNVGEVDYEEQKFYYKGNTEGATIVTTRANQVVDYVANNLQFSTDNSANNGWSVIGKDALVNQGLVNNRLSDNLAKFNNIIQTEGLDKELKPGESTEKPLVLSQLISTENTEDDLTYSNIVEIVKTSNTVGRRMAYSIVGNQHPDASKAEEIDSSVAEKVIILPPFGNIHILYILIAVIGIILIIGITLIIKKVLKK